MLSQELVLALLQASITGAGLVLAVYALIIPLSRRFFSFRAGEIHEELEELKERVRETDTRISANELSELKAMVESIKERQGFPAYLSSVAGATFFLYLASILMSVWWILEWNKPTFDSWLPYAFGIATFLFLLIRIASFKDISQTMKREFEELKEKVEEANGTKPSVEI